MNQIKVRFAPSPTGPLHIGGARSALFNYLFAKHTGGSMLLRIEDTDLERSKSEYEEEIIESLNWLGIVWDEGIGVEIEGNNGPYRQTERCQIYKEYMQKLLDSEQAYYCFCSEEELEAERKVQMSNGQMPRYSGKCRYLTDEQIQEKLNQGIVPAVRFKVPANKVYVVDDLVRGRVSFESESSGDFIIVKSDGLPTYNFAVVIDDVLMGVTHVIRAEEHLSNTPRQLMIYDALNLRRPQFAHVSLILGEDRQKMSKRHGATSLVQYREMGYLPEALFNFLALLGWSPEGEEEILMPEQIIKEFSLDRVSKSPAVFDFNKLNWMNQQYIKKLSNQQLGEKLRPYIERTAYKEKIQNLNEEKYDILITAIRDRISYLGEVDEHLKVFFEDIQYEPEAWEILQQEGINNVLQEFMENIPETYTADDIYKLIKGIVKKLKVKPKNVFMPIRCALTGNMHGPELPYLITIWGREETLRRINMTQANLSNQ